MQTEDDHVPEGAPTIVATALRANSAAPCKTGKEKQLVSLTNSRLHETVKAEAFHWGQETAETYHSVAASHMNAQWESLIGPLLAQFPIDYSRTIDFAAGYGRNARKLLEVGAAHITMVDVNPECVAHLEANFPHDRATAVLNNGADLAQLETKGFTFLYTFDAMVHFDIELVIAYLPEFARVLKPGAYALVHHSNYTANPGGDFRQNPHWRNFMSADIFKHVATRSGLTVLHQNIFSWGEPNNDCITILRRD
jgi:ubiquinone/menaquinone biosynthesis C-methylase UbiE